MRRKRKGFELFTDILKDQDLPISPLYTSIVFVLKGFIDHF